MAEKVPNDDLDAGREVVVEFFGIPRQRAGLAEMHVRATTLGELFLAIARAVPALFDAAGNLDAHCLASINGERFVNDPARRLRPGDHVLILSADVGG